MLSYGPCLDKRTYMQAVLALYQEASRHPSKASELQRRRAEMNLSIDHKLGVDFPASRREAMWAAHRRVDRKLVPLVILGYLKRVFGAKTPVEEPLFRSVMRELRTVLSPEEMTIFLDLPPGTDAPPPTDSKGA